MAFLVDLTNDEERILIKVVTAYSSLGHVTREEVDQVLPVLAKINFARLASSFGMSAAELHKAFEIASPIRKALGGE